MVKRQLEWSARSRVELEDIAEFYAKEASPFVGEAAYLAIEAAAEYLLRNPLHYREGCRAGTREYVMRRFPYTIVYRVTATKVLIVRVMHQAAKYFN